MDKVLHGSSNSRESETGNMVLHRSFESLRVNVWVNLLFTKDAFYKRVRVKGDQVFRSFTKPGK
jgi:hypothetical protein